MRKAIMRQEPISFPDWEYQIGFLQSRYGKYAYFHWLYRQAKGSIGLEVLARPIREHFCLADRRGLRTADGYWERSKDRDGRIVGYADIRSSFQVSRAIKECYGYVLPPYFDEVTEIITTYENNTKRSSVCVDIVEMGNVFRAFFELTSFAAN